MARIVFMGTPEFAVPILQVLIRTQNVVGVVTQPDRPAGRGRQVVQPPIKRVAAAAGIPVYQPRLLRPEEAVAPLRAWAPDLIVVAAFGQILRPHVLTLPPRGCLNVHASLLPRWRGASPIQHALLAGDETTGISLMQMDEGLDTGPVYVQRSLSIGPGDTAATLHDRLAALGADMVAAYVDDILGGRVSAVPQDDGRATYAPLIKKEDGRLDWTRPAAELDRRVRAMTPWPGAFTGWQGKTLRVLAARPLEASPSGGPPGEVVPHNGGAAVVAGEGVLELREVQLEGKRPLAVADFLRGRPDFLGTLLE